jgi:hypothetical protein
LQFSSERTLPDDVSPAGFTKEHKMGLGLALKNGKGFLDDWEGTCGL